MGRVYANAYDWWVKLGRCVFDVVAVEITKIVEDR